MFIQVAYKTEDVFLGACKVFFHIKSAGAWFAYEIHWKELEFMAPILAHGEEMSFQSKQMMNILFFLI